MEKEIFDCELCGSTPAEATLQGQKVCTRCYQSQYADLRSEDKELHDELTTCSKNDCLNVALKKVHGRSLCQQCAEANS